MDERRISLKELMDRPTISVEQAGAILGVGRSTAYDMARAYLATGGAVGLPCIRIGRSIRVKVPALLRMLGVDE
jgi:transposase